ncbi:hypothetical protein GTR02_11420 [Kineococcus sp. R8]|uniref:hypothetical protein n=1 Tax=Kineococcus siccus TaxID=2696567 RepID=UPI001412734A|nr:hypothetical protein [Kineococcus siccus]NAZ82429.1 hypothetical protein [Kineococcus siccus]
MHPDDVQRTFTAWLTAQGWDVDEVEGHPVVVAERSGRRLVAAVQGATPDPETALDTLWGSLLRLMADDELVRYALVVPEGGPVFAAFRVQPEIRYALGVSVYGVGADGTVTLHED